MSVSEAELRIAALADITVVQGNASEFEVNVPAEYEVTGITGASLESSEVQGSTVVLKVNAADHRHQFLISMERPITDSKSGAPFLSFKNVQRETGEVLIEGNGTMELTATEGGGLKADGRKGIIRICDRWRALRRRPFRFHRQPDTPLALTWTRFPDNGVLAAVVECRGRDDGDLGANP
jgi:hypothetical protein